MRKYVKILSICLLVLALQFSSISNVLVTYAAGTGNDVTSQIASEFIKGVDITEQTGDPSSPIGNSLIGQADIDKTTDFWLLYEFMVPNVHNVVAEDFIIIDVPSAIALPVIPGNPEYKFTTLMIDEDGTPVADAYLIPGNKIKLVFTDSVETLSNVGGAFYLAAAFDENEIHTDGTETEIIFGIPNETVKLTFEADPIPEPDPVTVQKDGAITSGTSIEWKVTVNKENVVVNNAVLVDVIPSSQSLDESSIQVNGVTPTDGVTVDGNTLKISLGDISTQQEITFVTALTEDALLQALEEGKTSIQVINNATLEHDDNEITNADSPKTVTIPLNILSKSGSYNSTTTINNTKNITWTIVVNSDQLAFNNAVIQDTLPVGLTFIAGSESITGASGVTPNVNGQELTFNLGNITDEVTITYQTEIDPSRFQVNGSYNFRNQAVLTWDGLTGTGVMKDASVGVGSGLFTKSGAGYNRSNGVISWSISINNENINLDTPIITDVIPDTQKFIEGSAKIVDHQGNAYSGGVFNYNAGSSMLSYTFNAPINSKYTITFDTKPVSTKNITANHSGSFTNTASFTSGTINFNSTGTQSYSSTVFRKEAAGYDLDTRIISWKFTVNQNGATTPSSNAAAIDPSLYNAIPLANVSIQDSIPDGLEFLPGSVQVLDRNNNPVSGLVTVSGTNDVVFNFNQDITGQYTILFETRISDLSKFIEQNNTLNNGNFNVRNDATLIHDETDRENTSNATQEIRNHIVSKKGIPTTYNDKFIDWAVYLNSNAVNLNQLLDVDTFWLVDTLQEGLELDTTSVALIAYDEAIVVPNSLPSGGNDGLGSGRSIALDGTHIKYDATTREFRFNLPEDITTAYKLSFRTYVTESVTSGSQFSNNISLFGSKSGTPVSIDSAYNSGDSRQVSFFAAGSIGYGNLGKFVVNKVDLEDGNKKLTGATFALYDRFGNKVQEKATEDGVLEFNRIKSDLAYYIKEVEAPVGYLLSGEVSIDGQTATPTTTADVVEDAFEVKLSSVLNQSSLALTFENEEIKANIEFVKQNGETNAALAGAQFGLFPRGATANSTPLAVSTSTGLGIVSFTNVAYGQYDIRELTAPAGFRTLTGVVHAVEVTEDDHGDTLQLAAVINELIKANIKLEKVNSSGTGIAGAEFSLYDSTGAFVAAAVSQADGTVEFENILAGQYTIEETEAPFGYVPLTGVVKSVEITEEDHGTTIDLGEVTNELIETSITFTKVDDNNNELAGASFGLYDSTDTLVQTEISEADGTVTFTNVGQGAYTVKEIAAPTGYLLSSAVQNVTITSADNGSTKQLDEFVNTRIKASIEFVKQNELSSGLAGAQFGLYPRGASATSTPIATSTSLASGKVSFENVEFGQYDIREIAAPAGYLTLEGVVRQVEVTADDHGDTLLLAPVTNELIRANIEFIKLDDADHELAGAQFTLYDSSDNAVSTVESDENGLVQFTNILAGEFTIRETKAPFGYVPITGVIASVTITEAEHGTTIQLDEVMNVLIQTTIEFVKNNENNQPLAGATFGLYDSEDELVQSQTSQSGNGKVTFTNIGEGSYTVKEISPPYGYLTINDVIYNVTVSAEDHNETIDLNPVANTLIEANIEYVKLNDKGQPLAGAEFVLLDENEDVVQTVVSAADGKVTFVDVREGEYIIREKTPPVGYNPLTSDVAAVEITSAEHATTVTLSNVTNYIIKGDVEFVKVAKNSDRPLRNATFALYAADDTTFDFEIATATSDVNGLVRFEDVEYGDYTIIEVSAPSGYYRSKDTLSVSVRDEGATYQLGNFENQAMPMDIVEGTIEINKVNEFGQSLAGAKFALYNVLGNKVSEAVTNSSGIARFVSVPEGIYTVKELVAPEKYVLSDQVEEVTIEAGKNNYVKLTFINERSSDAPWPGVTVQKVDDSGKALAGVKFALYKATDTAFAAPVANSITNANGIATFANVAPGQYVVKEVEALKGYILSTVSLPVTVTDDGKTYHAGTVENRIIRGDIVVNKVNELNEPLQGAEFGLYDQSGKLVTTAVSNSNGIASFKDIAYGVYSLKELTAPSTYSKSNEVIAINITEDGKVQTFTVVNIKVIVSGESGGSPGTGSNQSGGNNAGTGSNNGNGNIDFGTGGNQSGSNNGTTDGKGNTVGVNQSNELPKTGDSISTMLWLFAASGLLILTLLVVGRKRTQKQ